MSYVKFGNRISLLPVAQYCGLAARLSEEHGAGRAAAMSSAFHAAAAGAEDAKEKFARLTPEERETISSWKLPAPVTVNGSELTYASAAKEQPVGLDSLGRWADHGDVLTCGTLDMAWVDGNGVAYVGDIKKSRWTTSGPDSLQLLAYGYAWALKHGCQSFYVGLWIVEDDEWQWHPKPFDVQGFGALDLWQRIRFAASNNDGRASFGAHCSDCYARLHCPEYTAPAQFVETVLAPAIDGGAIDDPIKLGELVAFCERVKGMIEKVSDHAKEAARRGVKIVHPVTGKVLVPVRCKGRESLNQAKLFAAIPEATKFVERGNPYDQMRWKKP